MVPMRHKRKLYYPVGLLSLSILLFLFVVDTINDSLAHLQSTMEVNLFPGNYREYLEHRRDFDNLDIPPNGNWNIFTFTGDEKSNAKVFDSLYTAIKQFILKRDSLRSIEIRLDRKMPYSRFVLIMDMLPFENVSQFSLIDSSIWVPRFPSYRKSQYDEVNVGSLGHCVMFYREEKIRSKNVFVQWEMYFRNAVTKIPLPILLAWLGLFSLNIVRLVKWRKVK
ncbi:MAG: hypothetical protein WC209_00240 [Ignavibacteriaceae bacterium]|jgi:hypothetical protein